VGLVNALLRALEQAKRKEGMTSVNSHVAMVRLPMSLPERVSLARAEFCLARSGGTLGNLSSTTPHLCLKIRWWFFVSFTFYSSEMISYKVPHAEGAQKRASPAESNPPTVQALTRTGQYAQQGLY
jgi:hypothetical protein